MAFTNLTWMIGFVPCMILSLTNAELIGETRLLNDIFKEYKREARPCLDARKPVQVAVGFTLTRLDELVRLFSRFRYSILAFFWHCIKVRQIETT